MYGNHSILLKANQITKNFPGVLALDRVDFDLHEGEVHVLLGENGAGKSTLIKMFSGAYKPDSGKLFLNGKETEIHSPHHAINLGIATCYQEFNLIPHLSVAENIFLGRFPKKIGLVNKKKLFKRTQEIIDSIGINLDAKTIIANLGVAQQQMVEVARALSMNAKIYIMDEPTAVLSNKEIEELFRVIRALKKSGAGIIYISHRLEELPVIGDRVTVLRDGQKISTSNIKSVKVDQLIEMMVGRPLDETFPKVNAKLGKTLLKVNNMCRKNVFEDVSLEVNAGEIVGLAGLVGSKRTEVVRAIFGADQINSGEIVLDGTMIKIKTPRKAVINGISLIPEDRKTQGLVLISNIKDNIALPSMKKFSKAGIINDTKIKKTTVNFINKLRIKTTSHLQKSKELSGGNQQKVVIAKWLASGSRVFLFDEPTRGIDVKAKAEVYALMKEIVEQGAGIIMVSSEMPEVINMCNRVYVMNHGRVCAELNKDELDQETILKYALLGSLDTELEASI